MYKLLIVDDNSIQVQSLLHYIDWEAYGFDKIETASTGRDGLEKYFANKPDLIITDVAMPIMDGLEMVRQIRAANGDTVVLFISCYDNFDYLQSANETEAVSYILKPINQLQLEQSVKKAVSILKQREKKKDGGIETEILRLRRENFMYHMLCVHDDSIKFIESEKNLLGFEKFSLYILAKCDIINNDTSQAYTYLSYLKKDILKNKNVVINAENEKCISVLFMSASQSEDEFVKTVKKDIEECIRAGREKFSLMVVGAMSSVGRSEYDIPVLIKEAAHSLDSMNQKGNNALITTTASTGKYNAVNIKGEIMTAIAADDDGAMRKLARSLCEASAPHSPPDIEMVYVSVWAAVQMILSEQNIHVENLLGDSMVTFYKSTGLKATNNWSIGYITCFGRFRRLLRKVPEANLMILLQK